MAKRYPTPQRFIPRNPLKYIGNSANIIARSSWEKRVMIWFDTNPSILNWMSEEIFIPYISPIDQRPHRYFIDFVVKYKTKQGEIKKSLIEVKPAGQTRPPKPPKNMKKLTENFIQETMTWEVNKAKWAAAEKFAKSKGMEFIIITEHELGIK